MHRSRGLLAAACGLLSLLAGCAKKEAPPALVCLLTDYGPNEAALAQLKGSIYAVAPEAKVVDLLREAEGADLRQTAYLLDEATQNFAAGTIFVVAVDPGAKNPPVLVRTKLKKYYAAPDDGALTLIVAREGLEKAWKLDRPEAYRPGSRVAPGAYGAADVAGPVAARLALTGKPETLGTETKRIETLPVSLPTSAGQTVRGEIVYVDSAGNLVTNVPLKFARWLEEGSLLKFILGRQTFTAPLVGSVAELDGLRPGRSAAFYNDRGALVVTVVKGSAARVYGATVGESFIVKP